MHIRTSLLNDNPTFDQKCICSFRLHSPWINSCLCFWSIFVFLIFFLQVLVVSEDEILERNGDDRNVTLSDSIKEKTLRSELKGQVLRHLTKDTVVILDALNYIKGYRYELYCASKSVKTTQVTVHCDISSPTGITIPVVEFSRKRYKIRKVFG